MDRKRQTIGYSKKTDLNRNVLLSRLYSGAL